MKIDEDKIREKMRSPKVVEAMSKVKKLGDITAPNGPLQVMMKLMIDEMMEAERTTLLGYESNDRDLKSNKNSRNGYSKRSLKTSMGPIDIEVPRDRDGEFYPSLLEKYKKLDPKIEQNIIGLYAKGLSTRDITEHVGSIYGSDVSATLVSQVTSQIKDMISIWQGRPLCTVYSVVFFDAIFFKVRDEGKVVSKAAYTCFGINTQGEVDILGMWVAETEGARFWLSVLSDLRARGVQDILIACVDGLKGFPEAIQNIFPKTEVQLCIVHQIRHSIKYVSSKDKKEFILDLKSIYQSDNLESAKMALDELEVKWGKKYPIAVKSWHTNWHNLSAYFKYPKEIRKMIYTTNIVENVHRQFRKIMKTKNSFPNEDSLKKMLYLAIQGVLNKARTKRDWPIIAGQLVIIFEDRFI